MLLAHTNLHRIVSYRYYGRRRLRPVYVIFGGLLSNSAGEGVSAPKRCWRWLNDVNY